MRSIGVILVMGILSFSAILSHVNAQSAVTAESFRIVNVRSGPGVTNAVIGQLQPGTRVPVIGRNNEDGDWLLIELSSERGWVALFVVEVTGNVSSLPVVDWTESIPGALVPVEVAAAPPILAAPLESVTATAYRRANVRETPSTQAAVIGILERGANVMVVGRDGENNDWILVQTGDLTGWVAFFLVSLNGDPNTLPIVPVGVTELDAVNEGVTSIQVITLFNVNLRAAPLRTAGIVTTIPFNTTLDATGRTSSSGWLRVIHEGIEGWLRTGLVRLRDTGSLNDLPVIE